MSEVAAPLVRNSVPPVNALYQRNVPEVLLEAVSCTVPVPQRERLVSDGCVAGEFTFTVAITAVRVALSHVRLLVIVT